MFPSSVSSPYAIRGARLKSVNYRDADFGESSRSNTPGPSPQDEFVRASSPRKSSHADDSDEYMASSSDDEEKDEQLEQDSSAEEDGDEKGKQVPFRQASSALLKRPQISHGAVPSEDSSDSDIPLSRIRRKQPSGAAPPLKKMKTSVPVLTSKDQNTSSQKASEIYFVEEVDSDTNLMTQRIRIARPRPDGTEEQVDQLQPNSSVYFRLKPEEPAKDTHNRFALRDSANIEHVIPELAWAKDSRYCIPGTLVDGVYMASGTEANYRQLLRGLGRDRIKTAIKQKEDALKVRQQEVLDQKASSKRSYDIGSITLFNKPQNALYATEDIPTGIESIAEVAKQDWAYKGAFYMQGSEAEKRLRKKLGPAYRHHLYKVQWYHPFEKKMKISYISAKNSGGYAHNANAALKMADRLDSYLDYDHKLTNLMFETYVIVYRLPDGSRLALPHVEQPPIPGVQIRKGDELCVDYGPDFLARMREELRSSKEEPIIKEEPLSDSEQPITMIAEANKSGVSGSNPFKKALSDTTSEKSEDDISLYQWHEDDYTDDSDSTGSFKTEDSRGRTLLSKNSPRRRRELSIESRDLRNQYYEKTSKWLTSAWENSKERAKARATVQTVLEHPDWYQREIVAELEKQGLRVAQMTISKWGIGNQGNAYEELQQEAKELLQQYPLLSQKWIVSRQRHEAHAAARMAIEHPRWSPGKIVQELNEKGISVTLQQMYDWHIYEKNSPVLRQEALELYEQTLRETGKELTERWRDAKSRIAANEAVKIFLSNPKQSQEKIVAQLKKQDIHLVKSTLGTWGINCSNNSDELMAEANQLKEKMPFLTDQWLNSRRRAEANEAARIFHENNGKISNQQIIRALKKQGKAVSARALVLWGIHSRQTG